MNKIKSVIVLLFIGVISASAQQILTLSRAMDIAIQNSPDLRQAELSLERSQRNLDAQRASLKSLFQLTVDPISYRKNIEYDDVTGWSTNEVISSGGNFRIEQPVLPTGGTISLQNDFSWQDGSSSYGSGSTSSSFYNNTSLSLSQPIFQYNQQKFNLMSLELDYENTMLSYYMQRLNLESQVAVVFYNVYEAQMSLEIAKSEMQNNQESYDIISNKVEAGLTALEELYQAEVNLATSKSSVSNGVVSLENAKDAFKITVGMDLDEDFMTMANVEVTPVTVDLKQSVEYALGNRMEIRQREITIQDNQFSLITTKNNTNDFQGTIVGSIGLTANDPVLANLYDNAQLTPNVSVSFNIPIFDWGERKNRIKAAEATIESSEIDLDNEKRDIIISVRQVYRNLNNILDQIEIAKLNVKNAQLTFDINQERYQTGDITGMDLKQYQTQLSDSKMSLTNALIDYKIELLNLKIQTLYDYENNVSIVPEELVSPNVEEKK